MGDNIEGEVINLKPIRTKLVFRASNFYVIQRTKELVVKVGKCGGEIVGKGDFYKTFILNGLFGADLEGEFPQKALVLVVGGKKCD